ncbi:hypothetical protein HMPREF6745_2748 [Prevotella sp. oral taxon 472 str. F0295]|nr:hypothetical protein HMPREF6745_2748 [Prevotella sp. oral taxon 472 str. F0295]
MFLSRQVEMQCQGFALCFDAFANIIHSFRKMKKWDEKCVVMMGLMQYWLSLKFQPFV